MTPEAVRLRTSESFAAADFFKPEATGVTDFDLGLAPLIIHERSALGEDHSASGFFGAVVADSGKRLVIDAERATVYYLLSVASIRRKEYRQLSFVWFYPDTTQRNEGALCAQGVRLTLDQEGFPAILEVLRDTSGVRPLYVSASLEKAAAMYFGAPLAGRKFAVERSLKENPEVVVARVLDDGPVPMGPYVYVLEGERDVSTLLCRCMPSQIDDLRKNVDYELVRLEALEELGLDQLSWGNLAADPCGVESLQPVAEDPAWLEECLRLPEEF